MELAIDNKKTRINQQIRAREVRLISAEGDQLGVVPISRALQLAEEEGLDLVEVSPNAVPPVAKILDWGKYKYEQQKANARQKAKQKIIEVKTIRLGVKISQHDLETKLNAAKKFLEKENKVKFQVRFKGREITHKELGANLLGNISDKLTEIADVEQAATSLGRDMLMDLAPKKNKERGSHAEDQNA